jgi:hypothetical protein
LKTSAVGDSCDVGCRTKSERIKVCGLVAWSGISDPEKAVIAIENVYNAINQISQTTVRSVVAKEAEAERERRAKNRGRRRRISGCG